MLATLALTAAAQGETTTVYVGTGADGIYTLQLDEETGALTDRQHAVTGKGMGFQEISKSGRHLFSTYRANQHGAVASYAITDGKLTELSVQTYAGNGLCHVSLDADQKTLFGADYGGGKVVTFPVTDGQIGQTASLIQHQGSSIIEGRQEAAHAHSFYAGPDNKFAYAPDLGIDQVRIYTFDDKATLTAQGGVKSIPGSGPRHMKFGKSGTHAYVLNELSLTVTTLTRDPETGQLTPQKTTSVLPEGADGEKMSCSEIRVSQDGRFIYTATRDLTDQKRDTITVFSVAADGSIKRTANTPAMVQIPRNINLSPSGKWLLVAGTRSHNVTSHRIAAQTGTLTHSGHQAAVPKAMCINFTPKRPAAEFKAQQGKAEAPTNQE